MKKEAINRILQQNRDIYNGIADDFSNTRKYIWPGLKRIVDLIKPGGRVIDLGCGNGRLAELFTESNVKYFGLDNSQELVKIAKRQFADYENIKFQVGDITNLKLPTNQFNLVLLIAVLHHLPTKKLRQKALADVYGVTKPGGYLFITNWNLWSGMMRGKLRRQLFNFSAKWSRGVWHLNDAFIPWKTKAQIQYRYIHSFTKAELKNMLQQAGFTVEEIFYEFKGQKVGRLAGGNLVAVAKKK